MSVENTPVAHESPGRVATVRWWLLGIAVVLFVIDILSITKLKSVPLMQVVHIGSFFLMVVVLLVAINKERHDANPGLTFEVAFLHLSTDVFVAAFLALGFSGTLWALMHLGHETPAAEVGKEVFFAAAIGTISFVVAITARLAMVASKMRELHLLTANLTDASSALTKNLTGASENLTKQLEEVSTGLGETAYRQTVLLADARNTLDEANRAFDQARILTADVGAGHALKELLAASGILEPGEASRYSATSMLASFGQTAASWASFARSGPEGQGAEMASERRELLHLAGELFALEMAADIKRKDRLVVANIRYVTSLVCGLLSKLAEVADENVKPVWLAFTSYDPKLWLTYDPHFCEGIEPVGSAHIQFWGRYLRLTRHLVGDSIVALRAFRPAGRDLKEFRSSLWGTNAGPLRLCRTPGRDRTVRLHAESTGETLVEGIRIAAALMLDAVAEVADEIATLPLHVRGLVKDLDLVDYSGKLTTGTSKENAGVLFEELEGRLSKYVKDNEATIGDFVGRTLPGMRAWELRYMSGAIDGSRSPCVHAHLLRQQLEEVGWRDLIIDAAPVEVLMDAVLIAVEATEIDHPAPQLFKERWARGTQSCAMLCARPTDEEAAPRDDQAGDRDLQRLLWGFPAEGDLHAFGLVPVSQAGPDWDKTRWLLAYRASMAGERGVGRVDFLELSGSCLPAHELHSGFAETVQIDLTKGAKQIWNVRDAADEEYRRYRIR